MDTSKEERKRSVWMQSGMGGEGGEATWEQGEQRGTGRNYVGKKGPKKLTVNGYRRGG
jgi:hypothetical protein